ncbi:hypothetical protein [Nonomuraea jiangxiensis]|uniref:Uncharacterized protein n=1 Tax=Nonomuraea jiangxiensis TaxID=633440 RepID=A0A1G9JPQ2_9ACTN|nr:hypothetical protein [Nonomuraea jiangxiensis]SDL38973.1 hypothetical protein SAMN05421869_125100 [Nonomuraea jiangxiensis]
MPDRLCYADAVKLLGGSGSALVTALDYGDVESPDAVESTTAIGVVSADLALSTTNALTRVWPASSDPAGESDLERAYDECVTVILSSRPDEDAHTRTAYLARLPRQLAADRERLSPGFRSQVRERLEPFLTPVRPLVRGWADEAFGDL